MNKQTTKSLNKLLDGRYMGIDLYEKCIDKIRKEEIKQKLFEQKQNEEKMAEELYHYIKDNGGDPLEDLTIKSKIPALIEDIKLMGENDDMKILDMLSNGLQMGIDGAEGEIGNLHDKSKNIMEKQLTTDRQMFKELENLKRGLVH